MAWLTFDNPVTWWWVGLSVAAVFNAGVWAVLSRRVLARTPHDEHRRAIVAVVMLAGVYTLGCGSRSIIPRADVERFCLWDTWFSNVFVGRSIATVAELAFAIEGAIVLYVMSRALDFTLGKLVAGAVVVLIATAECFSWYAVISTNYVGNACEESLWATSYFLVAVALAVMAWKTSGQLRRVAGAAAVGAAIYVAFMVTHDVPMYLARHAEDVLHPRPFFTVADGVRDLLTRWVVTHRIEDWGPEIPWMTLYFTVAVWLSLALCVAPMTPAAVKRLQAGP
jgi:hypothetical protein